MSGMNTIIKYLHSFFNKPENVIVLVLTIITFAIKFYNFDYFATYHFEIAQHYLQAIKLGEGQFILEGPASTHTWFRFSAAPYYLFYPFFFIAKFHPLFLANVWLVISVFLVIAIYKVIATIYDTRTGVIASILYVLSANILLMDRLTAFFAFVIPLSLYLFQETYKVYFLNKSRLWIVFLIIACMTTLHPASFMLVPLYLLMTILYKKLFAPKDYIQAVIAFSIPQIPLLLNELSRKFSTITSFVLWVPYKLVQFMTGKTLGVEKTITSDNTHEYIFSFLTESIFPPFIPYIVGIIFFVGLFAFLTYSFKKKQWSIDVFFVLLLAYGLIVLFIHKNPPPHYFVPIMLVPIIILARFFSTLLIINKYKLSTLALMLIIISSNLFYIFTQYLFAAKNQPFSEQLMIAKIIAQDAGRQEYSLKRIGDFDHYALQSKENYIYLLWWLGNKPVENSSLQYTIVEDKSRLPAADATQIIGLIEDTVILKN